MTKFTDMKNLWLIGVLLALVSCNSAGPHQENISGSTPDSIDVQEEKMPPETAIALDTSKLIMEVNKILDKIITSNNCKFEYGENNAPNIDPDGETNIMKAKINEAEAQGLIDAFNKKCTNDNFQKFKNDKNFWSKGEYELEAYFNTPGSERSYFNCLIKGQNKHAFYSIKNN